MTTMDKFIAGNYSILNNAVIDVVTDSLTPYITHAPERLKSSRPRAYKATLDAEKVKLANLSEPGTEDFVRAQDHFIVVAATLAGQIVEDKLTEGFHILLQSSRLVDMYNLGNTETLVLITIEVV